MKKLFISIFTIMLALGLTGCGSSNDESKTDKLTDTSWTATKAVNGKNTMDQKLIQSTLGDTTLTFKKDGVVTIKEGNVSGSGTYSLKGENVTIKSSKTIKATYKDSKISLSLNNVTFTFEKNLTEKDASYSSSLTAGTYTIGIDIPSGTYNANVKSGAGSWMVSVDGKEPTATSIAKKASDTDVNSLTNIQLKAGNKIIVMGNAKVKVFSNNADKKSLTKRKADVKKEIKLKAGKYTAGVDFDAGTYNIKGTGKAGQVITDGKTVGGVNDLMSKTGENSSVKEVKNVELTAKQTITVTSTTATLVPSK